MARSPSDENKNRTPPSGWQDIVDMATNAVMAGLVAAIDGYRHAAFFFSPECFGERDALGRP
jgi:hypothetical protein